MYWLDGSSKLPFVPRCSYLLSSSRAKKFALAQDLIENQARIVKSCVKIGDFDHWCYAASELVDLVLDLVRRDEKYLRRDGLSSHSDSLRRISELSSQFVNFVQFSTFELAQARLGIKTQTVTPQPPPSMRRLTPAAVRPTAVTPASPRHTLPPTSTTTTTLHSHGPPPIGTTPCARTPRKEVDRKERDERKEVRREGVEKEERRGEKGEEKQKQGRKPPTPPPLTNRHEREPPRPRKRKR
jgi:hypothetical protein